MNKYIIRVFNDEKSYYGRFCNNDLAVGDLKALELYDWLLINVANGHGVELSKVVARRDYNPGILPKSDYEVHEVVLRHKDNPENSVMLRLGGLKQGTDTNLLSSWFWFLVNSQGELLDQLVRVNKKGVRA